MGTKGSKIVKLTTIGKQVEALSRKHNTCNYILGEAMAYILKHESVLPDRNTDVKWLMKRYSQYLRGDGE